MAACFGLAQVQSRSNSFSDSGWTRMNLVVPDTSRSLVSQDSLNCRWCGGTCLLHLARFLVLFLGNTSHHHSLPHVLQGDSYKRPGTAK